MFIQLQLVCGSVPGTIVRLFLLKVKGNVLPIQTVSSPFSLEFGSDCLIRFRRDKGSTQFVVHRICSMVLVLLIFFLIHSGTLTETSTVYIVGSHVYMYCVSPLCNAGYLFFSTNKTPSFFNFHTFWILSLHKILIR